MKKMMLLYCLINCIGYATEDVGGVFLEKSVVSSTTGFEEPILKENKNVFVVTKKDIDKKDYTSVDAILRDVPNVIIQETHFGPVIDMRGNGERALARVKVLVDGISINPLDESMGTLPINTIPINSIEKIEVIPGGGAVLNGSGTTGGVVNIITKSSLRKDFYSLDYGVSSYQTNKISAGIGQNITDNLYANVSYTYINGNGYRQNEDKENGAISGGIDYKINNQNRVRITASKFKGQEDSSYAVSKQLIEHNRKIAGFPSESNSHRESYSIDYEYKPLENLELTTTLYKQKYYREFTDKIHMPEFRLEKMGKMPFPVVLTDVDSSMNGTFDEDSKGVKFKGKYTYDRGELIVGYDYNKTKLIRKSTVLAKSKGSYLEMPFMNIPYGKGGAKVDLLNDIYKETNGFYALNKFDLDTNLKLISGIRYETSRLGGYRSSVTVPSSKGKPIGKFVKDFNSNKRENNFAGELGLNYMYRDTGSFYGRYERGFISPTPGQITDKIKGVYKPNNLKSETSDTFEIGVKDFIGSTFVNWTVFTTFTNDEITLQQSEISNPATKQWKYLNLDETRRIGTEFYAEQYINKYTFKQGVTYINTKVTNGQYKGDKIPLVPNAKLTLGVDYAFSKNWSSNLTFTYVGKSTVREFGEGHSFKDDKSYVTNISSYNYTDFSIQYKITDWFTLTAGINNIFNNKYDYTETKTQAIVAPERNYFIAGSLSF